MQIMRNEPTPLGISLSIGRYATELAAELEERVAMPAEPQTAAASVADIGERVYGVFDLVRPDRVAGWAIDRASAGATVEVELRREGKPVATVRADRHRPDLEKGGIGTGKYGFVAEISPPIEPGFDFTLTAIARATDGTAGTLKRTAGRSGTVAPEQRVVERIFEEVTALARTAPPPAPAPTAAELDRLAELAGRIEMVQIRLEAALAAANPPKPRADARGLRGIVLVTAAIALGSLGLGLYSLLLA